MNNAKLVTYLLKYNINVTASYPMAVNQLFVLITSLRPFINAKLSNPKVIIFFNILFQYKRIAYVTSVLTLYNWIIRYFQLCINTSLQYPYINWQSISRYTLQNWHTYRQFGINISLNNYCTVKVIYVSMQPAGGRFRLDKCLRCYSWQLKISMHTRVILNHLVPAIRFIRH